MAMSTGGAEDEPMMDINTTPLIDVMLVLLIMFIITIPIQTHAVKLDLPVDDPSNRTPPPIDPVKNKIVIMPDRSILWNGAPVDEVTLRQFLDQTTMMNPEPELHMQPHPDAPYEIVDQVLAVTKRANVTKLGFVGNEAYRNF